MLINHVQPVRCGQGGQVAGDQVLGHRAVQEQVAGAPSGRRVTLRHQYSGADRQFLQTRLAGGCSSVKAGPRGGWRSAAGQRASGRSIRQAGWRSGMPRREMSSSAQPRRRPGRSGRDRPRSVRPGEEPPQHPLVQLSPGGRQCFRAGAWAAREHSRASSSGIRVIPATAGSCTGPEAGCHWRWQLPRGDGRSHVLGSECLQLHLTGVGQRRAAITGDPAGHHTPRMVTGLIGPGAHQLLHRPSLGRSQLIQCVQQQHNSPRTIPPLRPRDRSASSP